MLLSRTSLRCRRLIWPKLSHVRRYASVDEPETAFRKEYKIRSSLERLIHHYAVQPLAKFSILGLYDQSKKLDDKYILEVAQETVELLLAYNARRLRRFRNLSYLVMLNPSISELYSLYLKTMSVLLQASLRPPATLEENQRFANDVLSTFIEIHADALPMLSRGFAEVIHLISPDKVKTFLDEHLKERISMRLIAHQHLLLTESLADGSYKKGSRFNGIVKPLNMKEVICRNADLVNDICLMKYDQTVKVEINTNLHDRGFWGKSGKDHTLLKDSAVMFPYIEYHLDYVLMELFKNAFRAHIENGVLDPVQVTVSISENPSYMELRIRDKGKGIPPNVLRHMFDYSFTTYESGEGESYKTLNAPPGEGGNTVAGMGYGLPLLKNYMEIFNDTVREGEPELVKGLLTVQTYNGWGTDVYLKTLNDDGKSAEEVEN